MHLSCLTILEDLLTTFHFGYYFLLFLFSDLFFCLHFCHLFFFWPLLNKLTNILSSALSYNVFLSRPISEVSGQWENLSVNCPGRWTVRSNRASHQNDWSLRCPVGELSGRWNALVGELSRSVKCLRPQIRSMRNRLIWHSKRIPLILRARCKN